MQQKLAYICLLLYLCGEAWSG